jgi:hypothetical protein
LDRFGHWRTYVPRDDHLTQRGGTFLLGFSATMTRPLSFLDPYLGTGD